MGKKKEGERENTQPPRIDLREKTAPAQGKKKKNSKFYLEGVDFVKGRRDDNRQNGRKRRRGSRCNSKGGGNHRRRRSGESDKI